TPAKLVPDVVKNTSTKILHRLTARDDRSFIGETMGMTEEQSQMVPLLRVGNAILHMEDQDKPIWVKIAAAKGTRGRVTDEQVRTRMAALRQEQTASVAAEAREQTRLLARRAQRLAAKLS